MSLSDLYCLMREELEAARRQRSSCPPARTPACEQDDPDDPDAMEDEHKPYFWNRRYL